MIDPTLSADLVALERASDFERFHDTAGVREVGRRPNTHARGLITPEMAAARKELRQDSMTESIATVAEEQVPVECESDPLGHLRAARIGFVAVVVLVIYWLRIRRKRA